MICKDRYGSGILARTRRIQNVSHLEKLSEIGATGGQQHLVGGQLPPLRTQGHIHKILVSYMG